MELIIHMKWHLSHRRKYITPLGEQQWDNTNEVQLKLFPRKQLWESNAKENTLSPQHRNTHRLFDCSSLIVFICKWRQMQFLWKENTSGGCFLFRTVCVNFEKLSPMDFMQHNWIQIHSLWGFVFAARLANANHKKGQAPDNNHVLRPLPTKYRVQDSR